MNEARSQVAELEKQVNKDSREIQTLRSDCHEYERKFTESQAEINQKNEALSNYELQMSLKLQELEM